MTDKEFCRVMELLHDEWTRCNNVLLRAGFTREEAAEVVGKQMTEWFNNRKNNI